MYNQIQINNKLIKNYKQLKVILIRFEYKYKIFFNYIIINYIKLLKIIFLFKYKIC